MVPVSLDFVSDLSAALITFLPTIMGIVLVTAVMLYTLAYITRYFEYLKMQESRWFDVDTLEFIHKALEWMWLGFLAILVLFLAQFQVAEVRSLLAALILRFPAIFFVAIVAVLSAVFVRVLSRFAAYLRGELRTKPTRLAPPKLLGFTEITLKYLTYIVATVVAVVGGVGALPLEDQGIKDWFAQNVYAPLASDLAVLLLGLSVGAVIILFVLSRLIDSVFEDMKRRSQKFGGRVMDQFKTFTKYAAYFVSTVVLLFLVVGAVLSPEQLVVFMAAVVLLVILATIVSFDALRNALAGITLMMADPFSVGDRVKIGDDLVCDVVSMGLTLTQLRTLKGEVVNLPNRELLSTKILNFSRSEVHPISVDVKVPFEVPHAKVEELLKTAGERTLGVEGNPLAEIYAKRVDDSAIVYQIVAFTRDPAAMKEAKSALIFHIQDLFHEEGIKVLLSGR